MQKSNLPTVLITGSSGFLGRAIAQGLQERYRVVGVGVSQARKPLKGMETIEIDLTSDESVGHALVFLFGLLIIPLGVVSVSFIVIQTPLIGALCMLCIIQATVNIDP